MLVLLGWGSILADGVIFADPFHRSLQTDAQCSFFFSLLLLA